MTTAPRPSRRKRVEAATLAVIFAFIVWTSFRPAPPGGWDAADLLHRHVATSIPLPTLGLILVVVLAIFGVSRMRS